MEQERNGFAVHPTGQGISDHHTDISMTGLFSATVSMVNSQRQTFWQRYSSMLIANSIGLGFVSRSFGANDWVTLVGAAFGLFVCVVWWCLTSNGWKFFHLFAISAARFSWPHIDDQANPVTVMLSEIERSGGSRILFWAQGVIGLFVITYVSIAVWAALRLAT